MSEEAERAADKLMNKVGRVEKVISLLKEGYYNILFNYKIERWDDDTPGCKASGCVNFPLCGSHLNTGCCLDGSDIEMLLHCPFINKPKPASGGCWYDCRLENLTKEERLDLVRVKIVDLENWLRKYVPYLRLKLPDNEPKRQN